MINITKETKAEDLVKDLGISLDYARSLITVAIAVDELHEELEKIDNDS